VSTNTRDGVDEILANLIADATQFGFWKLAQIFRRIN
jgi:hypothetical protein